MRQVICCGASWILLIGSCSVAMAQDSVRYYEENGATIREARTKVRVPIQEYQNQYVTQSYYQPQTTTQLAQVATPVRRPVTQYQWVPKWHGRWNILRGPHLAYHLEQKTTWAPAIQTTSVPVTNTILVPQERTAQVAVPKVRYEEREQITRTVMLPAGRNSIVQLPSDRLEKMEEASQLATAPFQATKFAMHPRYTPLVAAAPNRPRMNRPATPPLKAVAASRPAGDQRTSTSVPDYSAPQIATRQVASAFDPYGRYGGVARLDGDFPRYSTNNSQGVWQARRQDGGNTFRR